MEEFSEEMPHLYAEGIEYSETSIDGETPYPEIIGYAVAELDIPVEEFDEIDTENSVLHLYRGDSRENLEELGSVDIDNLEATEDLRKNFPLYFTTSEAEAVDHARRKPTEDRYLLKLEVPFENLDKISGYRPVEVARNPEQIDFEEGTMYFNQANNLSKSLEWVSTSVPEEWVKDIEKLD